MKYLILIFGLLCGCAHSPKIVTAPSTTGVKEGILKTKTAVDEAQLSNQQGLDAISRAELTTLSLQQKLELLKTFKQ